MKKVCIFCAETVKTCAAASEYIFYVSANVWLLRCSDGRLLLKDINERLLLKKKCADDIFYCVWLLLQTFQCFNERAAPSERYQ